MDNSLYIKSVQESAVTRLKKKGLTDEMIKMYSFEIVDNRHFIYDCPTPAYLPKNIMQKGHEFDWLGCLVALSNGYISVLNSRTEQEFIIADEWRKYERRLLNFEQASIGGGKNKGNKNHMKQAITNILSINPRASIHTVKQTLLDEYNDDFDDFCIQEITDDGISYRVKEKEDSISNKTLKNYISEIRTQNK